MMSPNVSGCFHVLILSWQNLFLHHPDMDDGQELDAAELEHIIGFTGQV